ncbi:hypothetical protein CK228_07675 [Mesorhizobium sp. WSM4312]|uniref:glycoside hydrolase family 19 protein n=1 Tax=Mesorhizobium sp. WSM4312 TaxID=2029411 RepID=UPI000BAF2F47|nr:glycoside hydrolase family 19 protein [Mesorhizobium sp. WSM4312]PBB69111.1 hypothetical protein CK228_07675 [Mesorhizobium sp. WSM4312]
MVKAAAKKPASNPLGPGLQPAIDDRLKEADLGLKSADIKLKEAELIEKRAWYRFLSAPLTPVLITAIAGFVVTQVTNSMQASANLALEREKSKGSLILKAWETGDPAVSLRNLQFLAKIQLIDDPTGVIGKLTPEDAPFLPRPGGPVVPVSASDMKVFFERYKQAFGTITQRTVDNLTQLFQDISKDVSAQDIRQVAYVLATIRFETANSFSTVTEMGTDASLEGKYGPDSPFGSALGNTSPGDGARYRGRGYLQITGRNNYQFMGSALNIDLVDHPELAVDPQIAYRITSLAMFDGRFTGKKLADYITADKADYYNARHVVGGLGHASDIADAAVKLEAILRETVGDQSAQASQP